MDIQRYLDQQYDARRATLSMERMLSGDMDDAIWREEVRSALRRHLGAFPKEKCPLDIVRHETITIEGVSVERIEYTSETGLVTPAYVLRKIGETAILPGVVAIAGHGYGHRDCVGLNADGTVVEDPEGDYSHKFALRLAQKGFCVIAPEPLGFGDLRLDEDKAKSPDQSSCFRIDVELKMLGRSLAGVRVEQAIRAIDALGELGGVEMNRIGMMGISGGGLVTTFATALDDRIRACVVSGYANTFKASILAMHHCVDNFLTGMLDDVEMPDILASIAPRPMLWESGDEDPIFPVKAAKEAFQDVLRVYRMENAEDMLVHDVFHGDHMISGAMAYDFLYSALAQIIPEE